MRRAAVLCLVLFLSLVASGPTRPAAAQQAGGAKIVGGPYAVNVGARTATVMWVVETGEASLGTQPGKVDKTSPVLHAESIVFPNLKAGTTYYYQAFPGDAGKGSFKTPPEGPAKFQFVVYGDTRTRHDVHRAVIAGMLKYAQPDFVMHTGDLVADGADSSQWPIFFDVERELLRKTAFFSSLGNHERNARNYFDFTDAQPHYSFNWGNAHFSVMDSNIEDVAPTRAEQEVFWQEQLRWLESDLRDAQNADFRFVIAHHPPETAVKRRQGENPRMTELEPMFEKYHLSAGFFGHDHNYQHYLKNGVHYFTTGGGGAPLYDVDAPPKDITVKVASTENFVVVNVDGKSARVEARKPDGELLDSTALGR
ncbi:MAG: metallophosphoesterase [Acidobacteriia bacterium]|nr:metallophosphoesterase [Terriglobia bacterium]